VRLPDFIEANIEPILNEWVRFARKALTAGDMDLGALRDHAGEMLAVIVVDLRTPQTEREQFTKSQGEAAHDDEGSTAAEAHGAGRAGVGFSVAEMMAEFRALRASVLHLWGADRNAFAREDVEDLIRFNEAIDQALAESVAQYTGTVDQSQDMFVAILGHDLRTPLHTVTLVTEHVLESNLLDDKHAQLMGRAVRSAKRMGRMIDDLLDFTRSRMGAGLAVEPHDVDLQRIVREAVDEQRSASPQRHFEFAASGDLRGTWDGARIAQVVANLVGNAAQHGDALTPVLVSARGDPGEVVIEVRNRGPVIPSADIPGLFGPFKRLRKGHKVENTQHLGLGLYIASQIVIAHEGTIEVSSSEANGTCFAAHLPRKRAERG
jgi:signal transduction histidine kinase